MAGLTIDRTAHQGIWMSCTAAAVARSLLEALEGSRRETVVQWRPTGQRW